MKELKFRKDKSGEKKLIGEGSHAKILLADWNGTPCAVKRMSATQAGRVALEVRKKAWYLVWGATPLSAIISSR